jgi:Flp pilus assembly protein TadG
LEFALALPLLVVLLIGMLDFGGAYNLKQKLNNAAREGARFAGTLKCSDCTQAPSSSSFKSTPAIRDVVEAYLTNANVPLCGTAGTTTAAPISGQTYAWTFTYSSSPCPAGVPFVLTVERSFIYTYTDTVCACTKTVPASRVTLRYPYKWAFSRVIGLMVRGANPALPSTIASDAIMQNEN